MNSGRSGPWTEPGNKPKPGLRHRAITVIPVAVLMAAAFGLGYAQNSPAAKRPGGESVTSDLNTPERQRSQAELTGRIVKARVRTHQERHACLSQVRFTSVQLETAGGTVIEAMLPLQVTTLEGAKDLFPSGKVDAFRLSRVENIKATDGSDLYAITDAGLSQSAN